MDKRATSLDDPLQVEVEAVEHALRVQASRIGELDADVERLRRGAEAARALAGDERALRIEAEGELAQLRTIERRWAHAERELAAVRATRLVRWSERPRAWYRSLRATVGLGS